MTTGATSLTLDEVEDIGRRMLVRSGASVLQAGPTACSIRATEADGIRTVGLSYLPTYCDHVAYGKVVGDADRPSVTLGPARSLSMHITVSLIRRSRQAATR